MSLDFMRTTVAAVQLVAEPLAGDAPHTAPNLLTYSRTESWQACKRKHKYRYVDQYAERTEKSTLVFGHAWHKFMEYWWAERRDPAEVLERCLMPYKDQLDALNWAYLLVLAKHYTAAHETEVLQYRTVKIEAEFRAPLIDPSMTTNHGTMTELSGAFLLGGKIDGILQDIDEPADQHVVLEHKTTKETIESDGDAYWNKLTGDHQLSAYVIGADALGYNVQKCLYDVVRKPSIRQKKGETWEAFEARLDEEVGTNLKSYFRWRVIERQSPEVFHALRDFWDIARLMEVEVSGRLTPRNPAACYQYGTGNRCPYFDTCFLGIPLDENPELMRKAPHAELTTAAQEVIQ